MVADADVAVVPQLILLYWCTALLLLMYCRCTVVLLYISTVVYVLLLLYCFFNIVDDVL